MIALLVWLIFLCIILYAVYTALGAVQGIPQPIKTLVLLLIAVIALYAMLHRFGSAIGLSGF